MRKFNVQVFDEIITGTGTSWYTSTEFNEPLGSADLLTLQAITTLVAGTSPTLTIAAEHSADGANFVEYPSAVFGPTAIASEGTYDSLFGYGEPLLPRVRFKLTLGGTTPACRVRLWVTGTDA
jgi:hypothetical protein